jgi:hypothetical protein
MEARLNAYELSGTPTTVEETMTIALRMYELRVEAGTWAAPDKKDEKIFALQAQLESANTKKTTRNTSTGQDGDSSKKNRKKKDFAWKKVPPKKGEGKQKVVGDKTYHWCIKHNAWTVHTAEECHLTENVQADDKPNKKAPDLKVSTVLHAIVEDDDASQDSDA